MGAAELGVALGVVGNLLLGLLMFLGKGAKDDIEGIKARQGSVETRLAVMESQKIPDRISAVEGVLADIRSDIRSILETLARQENHAHDRRQGDAP